MHDRSQAPAAAEAARSARPRTLRTVLDCFKFRNKRGLDVALDALRGFSVSTRPFHRISRRSNKRTGSEKQRAGYHWELVKRRGNDIIFAVDTSRSMATPDVRPNRLARAKLAIDDFVARSNGDAVGLVAFAGSALLRCPITLDYGAFHESLAALDTRIIPRGGTNITSAIQEPQAALQRRPDSDKVMILFTDGEDLEGNALAAAKAAAKQDGPKIYTVGVGSANGDLIPLPADQGGGYLKVPAPQVHGPEHHVLVGNPRTRVDWRRTDREAAPTCAPSPRCSPGYPRLRHYWFQRVRRPGDALIDARVGGHEIRRGAASPVHSGDPLFTLAAAEVVQVQDQHQDFLLVLDATGRRGWVARGDLEPIMPPDTGSLIRPTREAALR